MTARSTEGQSTKDATPRQRQADKPSDSRRGAGPPESGDVTAGVLSDLTLIAKADANLARSSLANAAIVLAREMDTAGNSATSKSMCATALLTTMNRLWELTPAEEKGDGLDDLAARRATRLGGRTAS